jgi:MbtH protein
MPISLSVTAKSPSLRAAACRYPGATTGGFTMMDADDLLDVVVNDEGQYSIWPSDKDIPAGWHAVGKTGTKDECLAHIEAVWTDMRPRSLIRQMST